MVLSSLQTTRSAQATHHVLPDGVRAMATVRVHADGLDPKDVTALLGLEPELAALKGGRLRRLPDGGVGHRTHRDVVYNLRRQGRGWACRASCLGG